ncbi:MAG: Zn-ribbon domain-containing OB-fold protein [Pseudomonadota bacterium]
MAEEVTKIQPRPTAASQAYWDGCAKGELKVQYCDACSNYQFYPRVVCSTCGSTDLEWRQVSGRGSIASYTVVRRGVSKAYEGPYVVALIDLEEGVRMMSHLELADPDDPKLQVGASVRVAFRAWSDDITVPVFQFEG